MFSLQLYFPANAKSFRPGDKIYFSEDGNLFGTVKDVRIIYKTDYYIKEGKEQITSVVTDEIKEIAVVAKVNLKNNSKGSFINGEEFIAPGKIISLSNISGKEFLTKIYSINNIFVQNSSN